MMRLKRNIRYLNPLIADIFINKQLALEVRVVQFLELLRERSNGYRISHSSFVVTWENYG